MWLLMAVLFAIVYAIVAMVASSMGVSNFILFVVLVRAHVHPVSDRAQDGRVVDARALYQT